MRIVPAKHGWFWLLRGFVLFRMNPAMWTLLVFTYWMLIAMVNLVPVAGPLVATLVLPAFSVSFMEICRELEERRPIRPFLLFSGFRRHLPALITMGALYAVSILLVLGITILVDDGALAKWAMQGEPPDAAAVRSGSLSRAMIAATIAGTPVVMAFWFAPALTAWDGMGVAKALFFSFFAGWRNWRAFMVYGAVLSTLGIVLSAFIITAAVMLRGQPEALRFAMILGVLLTMPTLFGSFYTAYRDVFPQVPARAADVPDEAPAS